MTGGIGFSQREGGVSDTPPIKSKKELFQTPCCYIKVIPISKYRISDNVLYLFKIYWIYFDNFSCDKQLNKWRCHFICQSVCHCLLVTLYFRCNIAMLQLQCFNAILQCCIIKMQCCNAMLPCCTLRYRKNSKQINGFLP